MAVSLNDYLSSAPSSGQKVSTSGATSAAGARIESGAKGLADNFQTFLTLLTAQLKNQDPLSPMDGNQFTQQLVQMSSVEQQLLTNDLLKSLVDNSNGGGDFGDPVDMIGKVVTAQSPDTTLTAEGAAWIYDLPKGVSKGTLEVTNAAGQVVWSGSVPELGTGRHAFNWDGKTSKGEAAAPGVYSLAVKAESGDGRAMAGGVFVEGMVTGVEMINGAARLSLGRSQVWLADVSGVRSPG